MVAPFVRYSTLGHDSGCLTSATNYYVQGHTVLCQHSGAAEL